MPITHDKFIEKYLGKFVEVAGSANAINQCTDLVNAYLREVLDQPIVEWTNARDFPSKLTKNFDWFDNDPNAIPKQGDLIIWQHNQWGHIGILDYAQLDYFHSFDQNYPTGSASHIQKHTYLRPKVAGWLRLKNAGEPKIYSESQMSEMREQRDENWRLYDGLKKNNKIDLETEKARLKTIADNMKIPHLDASNESERKNLWDKVVIESASFGKYKKDSDNFTDFKQRTLVKEKKVLEEHQKELQELRGEIEDLQGKLKNLGGKVEVAIDGSTEAKEKIEKAEIKPLVKPQNRFMRWIDWLIAWTHK